MHDVAGAQARERGGKRRLVAQIDALELEPGPLSQISEPRLLERRVVIFVQVIEAIDRHAGV
jgi:hypothetical protein